MRAIKKSRCWECLLQGATNPNIFQHKMQFNMLSYYVLKFLAMSCFNLLQLMSTWDSTLRPPTPDINSKATTPMAQTLERKSNTQDTATAVPCFHCLGAYFQCTKSIEVQESPKSSLQLLDNFIQMTACVNNLHAIGLSFSLVIWMQWSPVWNSEHPCVWHWAGSVVQDFWCHVPGHDNFPTNKTGQAAAKPRPLGIWRAREGALDAGTDGHCLLESGESSWQWE